MARFGYHTLMVPFEKPVKDVSAQRVWQTEKGGSMIRWISTTAALVTALVLTVSGAQAQSSAAPGAFDYYVMSFSWSPSYCANHKSDKLQCGMPRDFVVHGLWPQYNKGGYPASCSTSTKVPDEIVNAMLDIMPSPTLIQHEWDKHGTCSGLAMADYFSAIRMVWTKMNAPPELDMPKKPVSVPVSRVVQGFVEVNPGLPPAAIGLTCPRRKAQVSEVRVCLNKDLGYHPCGSDVYRPACPADKVTFRPAVVPN